MRSECRSWQPPKLLPLPRFPQVGIHRSSLRLGERAGRCEGRKVGTSMRPHRGFMHLSVVRVRRMQRTYMNGYCPRAFVATGHIPAMSVVVGRQVGMKRVERWWTMVGNTRVTHTVFHTSTFNCVPERMDRDHGPFPFYEFCRFINSRFSSSAPRSFSFISLLRFLPATWSKVPT